MKFDPFYGSVPRIGVEVEIQGYKDTSPFTRVNTFLKNKQYIADHFEGKHEWKCKCMDCTVVGTTSIFPVQWKPQYDGSLPEESGIEWISSIFPVLPIFMDTAKDAIEQITYNAYWKHGLKDKHNRPAYPSFHVHCSIDNKAVPTYYYKKNFLQEIQRTFVEFFPELLALASSCGYTRENLFFRSPKYHDPHDGKVHHIFIAPAQEHFEWRIWESPPNDPEYYESAMYVSASLTQASLNYEVLRTLEGVGLVNPSPKELPEAHSYLKYVNKKRMKALEVAATECSTIVANPDGVKAINRIFEKARSKFL